MFFIMGISNKENRLNFDQTVICKCCGKYGHIQIYESYYYFMFFFIPIMKWKKQYYVKMSCCNSLGKLDYELAILIKKGVKTSIDESEFNFNECNCTSYKNCENCGYTTEENFIYCPKCGEKFN